jgi:tRNA-splicing ligase RtcB (3'-phosphate/5'-hydroxy nucleic acid ligase)
MRRGVDFISRYILKGLDRTLMEGEVRAVMADPARFAKDPLRGGFAQALLRTGRKVIPAAASWRQWGDGLEPEAVNQMARACQLPISVAGALMPDAHLGYGLPIGGVLATRGAVIPYAVGVDIACRMKLTVLDLPVRDLERRRERLVRAIEEETRFGIGASFSDRREHAVLDADWTVSPVTSGNRDRAWAQLGTSGSGNHFVEFGTFSLPEPLNGLPEGEYVALLSHSGSRGCGAAVCGHYSELAMTRHRELPKEHRHLAWLDLTDPDGMEYWAAMELMGRYAAANHELIHRHIASHLGAEVLLDVENHHNFAWRETHRIGGMDQEVVVHRKGATPAGSGVLGIIPGSMATPGYLVRGRGCAEALGSASHGAGRIMSRKQAHASFEWDKVRRLLRERGVHLISAGIDEVPGVYKDIEQVMRAQRDLVDIVGKFEPRIVKMADAGERAED